MYILPTSGLQMTVEKTRPKQLLRLIITGVKSVMNQLEILAITYKLLKVREKSRAQGALLPTDGKTGVNLFSQSLSVAIPVV